MNPLTQVKRIQQINQKEAALGISDEASWHAKYKDSAYVYVGGIPFDLTEGDLLAVFAQYGEIVDVNLVRDKGTGKSKGFAFVAYEDQRSTNLAVDNLNGAQVLGRTIRVDHVEKYKKKEEEDEETERKKREARGVCRAFQKGECTRGAGCKFSHDEQRAANTGWGAVEDRNENRNARWGHDKHEGPAKNERRPDIPRPINSRDFRATEKDVKDSRSNGRSRRDKSPVKDRDSREFKRSDSREKEVERKEDSGRRDSEKRSKRDTNSKDRYDDDDRRHEKRSKRDDMSYAQDDDDRERRPASHRDHSSSRHRDK
uniref:Uncharacterized protein n=1 Tax=Kalanchoe fedtschenkoi TaxID=63787 RepID=A0A7N0U562_KALFE